MKFLSKLFALLTIMITVFIQAAFSQNNDSTVTDSKFKIIAAGPHYKRSAWHQFLWGKNYRKEWSTPVQLPVFLLDDVKGGLIPIEQGGGHQTTSLHLRTKDGKNYTLRSV